MEVEMQVPEDPHYVVAVGKMHRLVDAAYMVEDGTRDRCCDSSYLVDDYFVDDCLFDCSIDFVDSRCLDHCFFFSKYSYS